MEFTGERFIPKKAFGEIEIEHMQRYYSVLNIIKDKVVLDAACGVGYGTGMMSEHAKFVYGIDIDEEAIAEAQKLYGRENTAFIHSSIEKINLKDHSVDVVVSFETIEHVNHDVQKQFMREIKRILKPDGILIMSTPDKLYYSDLINHRNPFHIKEFYYDEFQLFLNNFFENVHMFKQGFEQLSVLSHSDEQIKERSKYKLIDPNQHTNSQSKYIVAVCSDIEIPNVDSIGSVMLLNEKPNLSSRLLADFGEGYREDVVVYSEIEIHGNEFRVEFRDLEQLYGVQRYKWLLIQDKMVNVKISSSFPEVKIEAINGWQSINGIDEFHNRQPIYEITGSISNIDKLVITGYIHILNESEIVRTFSNRITNLENQVQVKQEYSNIENQLSLISNYVQNQERLYREIDELKQLTELQHKNEEKLIEKQEILQLKNNNLLQHIDQIKSDYHHQLAQMKHMLNEVTDQRNHISYLHSQMQELNHSLLHSKSWKITSPLRSIANRKRIWTSNSRKAIKKIIKKTYRSLPLNEQRKIALKDFVYQNFKWALKNTGMYHSWLQSKNQNNLFIPQHGALKSISFDNLDRNFGQPGKIAVHLHLYYTDLLDEFYQYFSNIPYTFDLFVSIVHSDKLEHVQNKFSGISNIENLVVKVTPNRGRDVAPMFAEFGSELSKYDYFCHVHSKKSLYTGTQQDGWRRHLLDNLFGSPAILENVFALFHTYPNLGCIYPDTFNTIPYWAHTWLSNKGIGSSFLSRMGIKHDFSKYVDYPAGTMFWAKVSSLKPIFDLNLTYNDFAEEAKQIDGTIAHVIERALLQIVKSTGYDYCEVNFYHNYCSFNKGTKNLRQYWDRNINLLKNIIADVEIVTFDIFDTLITRPLLSPDTVFEIIETKVKHLLNPDLNYISMRKNAESEVRMKNNYRGDCSIHEIYEEMITLYNISADLSMQLKQMEIDLEIKLAMPREDVVDCLNYAKALNKKVILISDMYLDKKIVTQMLNKCNIHNYDELWISSETGMRKDTGEIWSKFVELYGKSKTVHVGDNEHSDVQLPGDRDLITFHVMNGSTMFYNTNFGHLLYDSIYANENWGDSILLGPIVAKQLNSPFKIKNGQVQLTELKEVGYTIFGPILLQYIIWLTKKLQENHETKVLFLAREGYLLKKLFDKFYSTVNKQHSLSKVDSIYFLTSRRASSIASIVSVEQIHELLTTAYEGNLHDLLYVRFGVHAEGNSGNKTINLPDDYETVKADIEPYIDQILEVAQEERTSYLQYCESNGLFNEKIAIVDLGYSGSIQLYLSRMLNQSMSGYYFVTNNKPKAHLFTGNKLSGYFGENEEYFSTKTAIYKYHLILESILTSNQGQFMKFSLDEQGELQPNYGPKGFAQFNFQNLYEIMEGIESYFDDILSLYGDVLLDIPYSEQIADILLESFVINKDLVSDDIRNLFIVEDTYCSSTEITVFDLYARWFGV